jgi:hypothetical protein
MKTTDLDKIIDSIGAEYEPFIEKGARHYIEVCIGKHAEKLGFSDLKKRYRKTYAIVPLHAPRKGMKVRIDGRTFVNYAEYPSGVAVPGYLAKESGRSYKTFIPNDSMICNYSS